MIGRLFRRQASDDRDGEQAINDFQSDIAEIIGSKPPLAARSTIFVLTAMVIVALLLSAYTELDRVVTAPGRVVSKSPTVVVQPLDKSIVRDIHVRPGDVVTEGQVLVTLDPTILAADLTQLERRRSSLEAEIERLEAELAGTPYDGVGDDPYILLQTSIYRYRQAEYTARIANFDQRIAASEAVIARAEEDVSHYRSRLQLLSEIESIRVKLEQNQVGSRLLALEASDSRLEVSRGLASSEGTLRSAAFELAALKSERDVYMQEWRAEAVQVLVEKRGDLDRIREELAKAQLRRGLVELRAVRDAVVLEMSRISVGSVVESAERLFTLVPVNAALEIEATLSGYDQGFVKLGDHVKVKLDAFPFIRHGTVEGIVRTISEDSFGPEDGKNQKQPRFFKASIEITDISTLRNVPSNFRLIPGMPLTADIVVGQRSMISYVLNKVYEQVEEGMREP